jgi:hypothetical protein
MKKSILPGCVIALFLMMGMIGCGSEIGENGARV